MSYYLDKNSQKFLEKLDKKKYLMYNDQDLDYSASKRIIYEEKENNNFFEISRGRNNSIDEEGYSPEDNYFGKSGKISLYPFDIDISNSAPTIASTKSPLIELIENGEDSNNNKKLLGRKRRIPDEEYNLGSNGQNNSNFNIVIDNSIKITKENEINSTKNKIFEIKKTKKAYYFEKLIKLKSEIFSIILENIDNNTNCFENDLKEKSWKELLESHNKIDLISEKDENEDIIEFLGETPFDYFKKVLQKIESEKNKKLDKRIWKEITKLFKAIINISKENEKKIRKDDLFNRLKTMIVDYFLYEFNQKNDEYKLKKINNKKNEKSDIIPRQMNKEIDKNFMNSDFSEILRYYKNLNGYQNMKESNGVEELINKSKIDFLKWIMKKENENERKKFFELDIQEQEKNYKNTKCKKMVLNFFETKNLDGLILSIKLTKIDVHGEKKYLKILNQEEFLSSIKKLEGCNDFSIDLNEEENDEIKNRIKNIESIANEKIKENEKEKELNISKK